MKWYQTAWGIVLAAAGLVAVVGIVIFVAVTVNFWWQIKQGKGVQLQQSVYGGFDRIAGSAEAATHIDRAVLENGNFPFLGNPSAPITIVLFGDFKCPNTKKAWPILQRLLSQYTHKIKLVFRQFPAESIPGHEGANKLAQLAVCTYNQNQEAYWGVHNYLFANQEVLPTYLAETDIKKIADDLNLDLPKLQECLRSSDALVKINRDYADGIKFGVAGTPTFFINGQKVEGVIPWEVWDGFVKQF
jgi:protein-disulfide isomerase